MKIVVTSQGPQLDSQLSPVFGRCPYFIFVDTESLEFEAVPNEAMGAPGGAGIQAAQFVVNRGAQAVITGRVGPNALNVLQAAAIPIYMASGGTVREAVDSFKAGALRAFTGPAAGFGMGAGMGRGMGMGRGRWGAWGTGPTPPVSPPSPPAPDAGELRAEVESLKKRVDELLKRLESLERSE